MTSALGHAALAADARNRALRVFLVGLAIDLAVAIALLVQEAASSTSDPDWRVLGASLVRTVLQTSAAYVLRRFIDPSRIPTPLPPAVAGPPADVEGVLARHAAAEPDLPPLPPLEDVVVVDDGDAIEVGDEVPSPRTRRLRPR